MTIRVLLADDHALVRQGLRALLESKPGFTVVGEASDGREAVQLVEELHPDVVVMDIGMPGLNGLEATVRIASKGFDTRVVILSMYTDEIYVHQALRGGASARMCSSALCTTNFSSLLRRHTGARNISAPASLRRWWRRIFAQRP